MAQDNRTEKATPKKRKEEREKGHVSKSTELSTFFSLLALALVVFFYADGMVVSMVELINQAYILTENGADILELMEILMVSAFYILLPIFIVGTIFHVVNYMVQVGFMFEVKVLKPRFSRINPKNYFQNLVKKKASIDVVKSFIAIVLMGYAVYLTLSMDIHTIVGSIGSPWLITLDSMFSIFMNTYVILLIILFFIGALDFVYQRYEYEERIKMKKEDVKDEHKTQEGNPETKRRQMEARNNSRSMKQVESVAEATVLINNPTHITVALYFKPDKRGKNRVPKVVGKGKDRTAQKMRWRAEELGVPMVENKPLARSMYHSMKVGQFIDSRFYNAVSRVLKELVEKGLIKGG